MGFMSNSTAMTIFNVEGAEKFELDALHQHVFSPDIDAEGVRRGWVGLGDPLDFSFPFGEAAFSLRLDTRKPSSAAIKIQLAEALQKEADPDGKVSSKRKKELKEAITAKVTARSEFIPSLIDCLFDAEGGRLLVSAPTVKAAQQALDLFKVSSGIEPEPIMPQINLSAFFDSLCRKGEFLFEGPNNSYHISSFGSASLGRSEQTEEKSLVAVQNNPSAIVSALDEGLTIQKLRLVATLADNPEYQLDFVLDTSLGVSGLRLPKAEKGADKDADFLLKTGMCWTAADLVESLGQADFS